MSLALALDLFWLCTGNGLKRRSRKGKKLKSRLSLSRYSQAAIQFTVLVLYKRKQSCNFTGYQMKSMRFKMGPFLHLYLYYCCQVQIEKAIITCVHTYNALIYTGVGSTLIYKADVQAGPVCKKIHQKTSCIYARKLATSLKVSLVFKF